MTAASSRLRQRGIGAGVAALVGLTGLGFAAVPAQAAAGFDPTAATAQVAGADRFETAALTARAGFTSAQTVVIANGDRVIDAQAASYVAGLQTGGAPILLVKTGEVPSATANAIRALGATRAIVIGDDVSVNATARGQLTAAGITSQQVIAGDNRFDTAADIYNQGTTKAKTVFLARGDVATGTVSADALSAGPLAYKGTPILLTNLGSLPAETKAAITSGGVTNVVVLGNSINDTVKNELRAIPGVTVSTIAGDDRTLTAKALAESSFGQAVYNKTSAAIANGDKVDALAAGPWAAIKGTPILLTLGTNSIGTGTTGYLDANKATLTSATVFGDSASVPAAFKTAAKTAGGGDVTAGVSSTVTNVDNKATGSFVYADATAKASKTATFASTDAFLVDGASASIGAFQAALTVGDVVTVQANTPSAGVTTYSLTNRTVNAGLVGAFNTASATTTYTVADPTTGSAISAGIDYTPGSAVYTIDGRAATQAAFEADLSIGDSIAITGGDGTSSSTTRTFALTNGSVSGTATSIVPSATVPGLSIVTPAGGTLGPITLSSTSSLTVDGAAVNVSAFNDALSAGDSVVYSSKGGTQSVALTNAAPVAQTVTVKSINTTTNVVTFYTGTTAATSSVDLDDFPSYKLNGIAVTLAEFVAATTPGDQLVVQTADTQTSTSASVSATDQALAGKLSAVDANAQTFSVLYGSTTDPLVTGLNYATGSFVFSGNSARSYFVNGTSATLSQFNSALSLVQNGTQTGTVNITDNNVTTEFRITTAANSSSANFVSVVNPGTGAVTQVTVNFDKPVYYSGTFDGGDFVVLNNGAAVNETAVSPSVVGQAANQLRLSIPSTTFATSVSVQLTAAGAAKVLDASGVAAKAATQTVVPS